MKQIEFTSKTSLNGAMYGAGDRITVSDEDAQLCCKHGWAKDLSGELPTGELKPGVHVLDVKPMTHKSSASKPGEG